MRLSLRPTAPPRLVHARLGVFGCFATSGLVMGVWAANLPSLDERLSLGPARLGTVLLLVALGALLMMPIAGRLCDRLGSRTIVRFTGPLAVLALLGPALANSYLVLCVVALGYGAAIALGDVSMNVNSVELEAHYGRPIVSAFHGLWSMGGALGGALTALGLYLGLGGQTMLTASALIGFVVFIACARPLLPAPLVAAETTAGTGGSRRLATGLVLLLGVVALAGHLSEGAAIDWAAFHTRQVLASDVATAPIAYTVFSTAMTVVRLFGDPIRERFGAALTLCGAGVFATIGYVLVLIAPLASDAAIAVAFVGWAFAGVGLATVVPVIFSEVGAAGGAEVGKALSTVTAFGSAGLLVGPAAIGHLADATDLPTALLVPTALAVLVGVAGPYAVRALRRDRAVAPATVVV
ncbi:MFS transporter [Stackebrandtia soli]|uniref:MFS transporter n=1 Tax=Stackebrandtia soli TaxID=1892856 RepID=UPI0039E90994